MLFELYVCNSFLKYLTIICICKTLLYNPLKAKYNLLKSERTVKPAIILVQGQIVNISPF
jgi:hypothetical protein